MRLTELPYSIFLDVWSYVAPADIIVCRRLSSEIRDALMHNDLCMHLVLFHFPRSREARFLRDRAQKDAEHGEDTADWAAVFANVARRYFHLNNAMPWRIEKIPTLDLGNALDVNDTWERYLELDGKRDALRHREPYWACAASEGLLVYPARLGSDEYEYRARNLANGAEVVIPFGSDQCKYVRRVRLSHGVLIFDWCYEGFVQETAEGTADEVLDEIMEWPLLGLSDEAFNDGQDDTPNPRFVHFVTAYSVTRTHDDSITADSRHATDDVFPWSITLRSQWRPYPSFRAEWGNDVLYSAHNERHYVAYSWRARWINDPHAQEAITVWDMGGCSSGTTRAPHRIREIHSSGTLGFWDLRQSYKPTVCGLQIDDVTWDEHTDSPCGQLYVLQEDHRWSHGPHTGSAKPRLHWVRSTGVPLVGSGPRWMEECGGGGDNGSMDFCRRSSSSRPRRQRSSFETGETRPGRAPCWRHDDFPYLTVAEVCDAAAGVRFSFRRCFMLETMSVHMRPKLCVRGAHGPVAVDDDAGGDDDTESFDTDSDESTTRGAVPVRQARESDRRRGTRTHGPAGVEVQFADGLYVELARTASLCGDERWLIGQDAHDRITVVHF